MLIENNNLLKEIGINAKNRIYEKFNLKNQIKLHDYYLIKNIGP